MAIIHHGRKVAEGTPSEMRASAGDNRVVEMEIRVDGGRGVSALSGHPMVERVLSVREDAFTVQTALSRVVFGLFTGATFLLSIYPGWVEWLARLIPFTWAFDLERRVFLLAEPLSSIAPDLSILLGLTLVWWVVGYVCFRVMLNYSKRNGRLGIY